MQGKSRASTVLGLTVEAGRCTLHLFLGYLGGRA